MKARERVLSAFNNNGFDHIPVKRLHYIVIWIEMLILNQIKHP